MIKLKNILSEGYAWERQDGKPLPTMKDVQEAYDAKGVEEAVTSRTHVVYACNVEMPDGTIKPDVRISVPKGDGAESEVRKKLQDRYKGCKIRKITKAQNPGKNDDSDSDSEKRWQDNDGDGKWYEKGDDIKEGDEDGMCESCGTMKESCTCDHEDDMGGDESALNMGNLGESFWKRVNGNLKGHEYILREAFRK
jgi:hypothetical protein